MNSEIDPLAFRPLGEADIPTVRDLAERIWRASYREMISTAQIDYMLAWMYSPEKIAAELAAGIQWELALIGEAPAGYLAVEFSDPAFAELHKLYLLPEHQGRGFGQAMLAHALEIASTRGRKEVRLRVNKQNLRALKAYERAGFVKIEALVADIGGGFVMDDFILARPVP